MRIALAQLLSSTDPAENLKTVAEHVHRAAEAGASLVVFPEAAMCRFGVPLGPVAQPLDGPWAEGVRAAARSAGVTVLAGMFTPADDGRVHNTLLAVGPEVDTHYDKIHLFDAFGFTESRTVSPGEVPVIIRVDGVGVGLSTCYDIRFPGLYQALAERGAEVIAVAASWGAGAGKVEQWELLARARALDSTSFVVACGQADPATAGEPAGKAPTGVGHSLVVSPTGAVLAGLGPETGLLVVDVNVDEVAAARQALPVLVNRRW